jgi:beta-glucosidase
MIDVDAALASLSLEQKCLLLAGETNWRTRAYPEAGIPQLKMSDGPTGVRGEGHGSAGTPGVAVPAGITLGATWDPDLLAEIGDLLGRECRRKNVHVLLGPTINLHRTPLGGRTFECYSEDPELSGALAARYVAAVQAHDVAVTVKHLVCNDTEIERMSVDVEVDERTLRELYLRPFERAVKEGGAWGIMSAYNRLGGEHCAHNHRLLTDILRDDWGFDGVVVSDWYGVHRAAPAANAGLTVEMPGPVRVYGDKLASAVRNGEVDEARVDSLVRELLGLVNRTRADERSPDLPEESVDDPAERALTRRAAVAGTVLLRNKLDSEGRRVLPLANPGRTVAVIGPNAVIDRSMGGGSASLQPFGYRTFFDALSDRLVGHEVEHHEGVRIDRLAPIARSVQLRTPDGQPGLLLEYVNGEDWDAEPVVTTTTPASMIRFFGTTPEEVDARMFGARVTGTFVPDVDGPHSFGVVSTGPAVITATVRGEEIVIFDDPERLLPRSKELFGYGSIEVRTEIDCRAGEPIEVSARWRTTDAMGFAALRMGFRPPEPPDLMELAVAAAAQADVAVVMVGTNDEWETEGFDRTEMELPGRQDELVERVVAANPETVVIVNAGSPVTMDWAGDEHPTPAPAVLTSFFAGQEQAEALVDVILGDADPGGRLPVSFPRRLADTPAFIHHLPDHDSGGRATQRYGEGLFMGYRWYDERQLAPRFPFGHGLSYGEASWGEPTADRTSIGRRGSVTISVPVTATDDRDATVVVQGYVAPVDPPCTRPPKELKSWTKEVVAAGTTRTIEVSFTAEAFHHWDTATDGWIVAPGEYDLVLAASATDERSRIRVIVEP